jgi:hypothetical protein
MVWTQVVQKRHKERRFETAALIGRQFQTAAPWLGSEWTIPAFRRFVLNA